MCHVLCITQDIGVCRDIFVICYFVLPNARTLLVVIREDPEGFRKKKIIIIIYLHL